MIELEKRMLNQIDGRNIRTSLQKRVVSRSKATASPKKKPDVGEYDMPDKRQHNALLTNSSNETTGPSTTILKASEQHFMEKSDFLFRILPLESKYRE